MRKYLIYTWVLLAGMLWFTSCEEEPRIPNTEAELFSYNIVSPSVEGLVDQELNSISIVFPTGRRSAEGLLADFVISEGAVAEIGGVIQQSRLTPNSYEQPMYFQVVAEDGVKNKTWKIVPENNDYSVAWGLGGFVKSTFALERDYEWYTDQGNTGEHSRVNCGPCATVMAAKWSDETFSYGPEDARSAYRSDGGWWYTSDISSYLTVHSIPHRFEPLTFSHASTASLIRGFLDKRDLVLLCLDMFYVRKELSKNHRVGRFYNASSSGWGHFILVKGYTVVDGKTLWDVYDPYSFGDTYPDGTLKGRSRFYRSEEIFLAAKDWWNHAIVISDMKKKGMEFVPPDLSRYPHARGR